MTRVAILATLILIAGALQLTRPGYSVDEEFTVFAVRGIQASRLPVLPSGLLYDRGLAYSYASWIAGGLSGSTLPAYRALSLLSALAVVGLTFALIHRLATDRAAVLAAVLVSASIPFWAAATTGRFYAPFLATYLAVLFLLANRGGFVALVTMAFLCRQVHELAFTLAAVPVMCLVLMIVATAGGGLPVLPLW